MHDKATAEGKEQQQEGQNDVELIIRANDENTIDEGGTNDDMKLPEAIELREKEFFE